VEAALARMATGAHGLVTHRGMTAAGITRAEIRSRRRSGLLYEVHRGVYRVGHRAPTLEARYLAAVLACGDGAVLSGMAAAHLLALTIGTPPAAEVTCVKRRRVKGVITHRSVRRPARAISCRGVPVTSVARTLVDISAVLAKEALARACHEAGVKYRTTPRDVEAELAEWPNAKGSAALRAVLRGDVNVTLSRLERRFVFLLRAEALPRPVTNRPAGGRRVDCRWPEHRLTVELDSYRYHSSRHAWEQDRRREREAYARGENFRRYTWGDVFDNPRQMLAELRALLLPPRRQLGVA
jgi:very-short-patch-repair endonuclease